MIKLLKERVQAIREHFDINPRDPREKYSINKIDRLNNQQQKTLLSLPPDLQLILREVGEVSDWGFNECGLVSWWFPRTIEQSQIEGLSLYDFRAEAVLNSDRLLFFAYEVDARCLFVDTASTPWGIVSLDGLSACSVSELKQIKMIDKIHPSKEERSFIDIVEAYI